MTRKIGLAVLTALFAVPAAAQAQQAITIKLKERGPGEAAVIKRQESTSTKVTVTDAGGNVLVDQREIKGEITDYTETILARMAGKAPTKLERAYTKAQKTKDKEATDLQLAGKTVVIVKKGEKYEFTYKDGGAVEGQAAALLAKDFSKKSDTNSELEKLVLPKGPVKVGETWKIDMPRIVAELGKQGAMELDGAKATGKGTLIKAYKKDGRQFGEMKFKMEMPITTIGEGNQQLKFAAGAKIALDLTFDTCIDGTAETGSLKMKMKMTGTATAQGNTVNLNVTVDGAQTQLDAKK